MINNLIENDYKVFFDTNKKNIKNQIKDAGKKNASFIIIIDNKMSIKNIKSNEELIFI